MMMFPPSLLRVRVLDKDSRVSLWIPLVLVWPLVFALYLILLPCIVVAAVLTWRSGWGKPILMGGPRPVSSVLRSAGSQDRCHGAERVGVDLLQVNGGER